MSKLSVQPIGDIVFVYPEVSASKIEVLNHRAGLRGRVAAAGPEVTEIRVNDMVRLAPGRTIEAVFDQKQVWVTREDQILAVEEA